MRAHGRWIVFAERHVASKLCTIIKAGPLNAVHSSAELLQQEAAGSVIKWYPLVCHGARECV